MFRMMPILFIFFFLNTVHAASVKILSQTVGQSSDQVITSREVQIAIVVDSILFPPPEEKNVKIKEIQVDDPAMAGFVSAYLLDVAITSEANSFSVGQVEDTEVEQALQKVKRITDANHFWQKIDVSDNELKRIVRTKLTSRHYVMAKTGMLESHISDQEAQTYFEKNRTKFGAMTFVNFKESIKTYLAREQLKERLSTWFDVIKKKYKVRNLLVTKEREHRL